MSEHSERELAQAIRELKDTVGELRGTVGGLKDTVGELQVTVSGLQSTVGELQVTVSGLQGTVGELKVATERNTVAINTLTGRVDKLEKTMEQVGVRLASKLDAAELSGFVDATNKRFERIERRLELV